MMMTTNEAAAALGLTRRRVNELIRAGKLRAEKPGRDWIVDAASVEELKAQNRTGGRPKKTKNPSGGNSAGHSAAAEGEEKPAELHSKA